MPKDRPVAPAPFRPVDDEQRARAAGREAADRRGRTLVEAAAGTGKTTVLVERVLNYLEAGERRLSQIAVVTFTEAAAAELKVRLRRSIGRRLRDSEDEAVRAHLRQALSDLEAAAVGTIHSFCLDLLKQRPVEAGVDPGFTVADEFERRLLRTRAWEGLLRRMDPAEPALRAAADLGLAREEELRRIAFTLVEAEPSRLPPVEEESQTDALWWELGGELRRALSLARPEGALAPRMGKALDVYRRLAALSAEQRQRAVLDDELKIDGRGGSKAEAEAKAARSRAKEILLRLKEELVHARLTRLSAWLSDLRPAYRALAARESQLDFDQLVSRTLSTLRRSPSVLADFRRRYPVILVDEFQDTDRVQTELLLLLAGDDEEDTVGKPRSLFLVGDPKQSIYRFRGADLENYNRVQDEELGAERIVLLRQTFRPLPALAHWVNEVMERVMVDAERSYEVPYRPLVPREPEATPESGGVLYLDFEVPEKPGVEEAREAEAEAFARLVHQLVRGGRGEVREAHGPEAGSLRPARFGDIALLLPKMTMLEVYERTFHRFSIPFRVVGGRHYFRRDEVHALLELLKALADPGDPVSVVSALRGPGFGVSDSDLMAYALVRPQPRLDAVTLPYDKAIQASPDPRRARRVKEALEGLGRLRREVLPLALPELVAAVLESTGILPFYALQYRGEQRLANLRKVVEVARRVEAGGRGSLPSFIRWLETLLEEEPEESDSPYLEGAGTAIRVMTVHKSKGLEFPIVLLGGLPSGGSMGGRRLRLLEQEDGGLALHLSKSRGTRGHGDALERDERRAEAEAKRLLYVATTRARDLLVLPYPTEDAKVRRGDLFELLYAEGVGRPEDVSSAHRRRSAGDLPKPPESRANARIDLKALEPGRGQALARRRREVLERPLVTQVPRLLRPSPGEGDEELPGPAAAARAAAFRLGILVHDLLARALAGDPLATIELDAGVEERERREAERLARVFLASPLAERARTAEDILLEESIAVAGAGGRVLDGQIDLAFREAEGWVVVDYKTDKADGRKKAPDPQLYIEQLGLYGEALARITGVSIASLRLFYLETSEEKVWRGADLETVLQQARVRLDAPPGADEAWKAPHRPRP